MSRKVPRVCMSLLGGPIRFWWRHHSPFLPPVGRSQSTSSPGRQAAVRVSDDPLFSQGSLRCCPVVSLEDSCTNLRREFRCDSSRTCQGKRPFRYRVFLSGFLPPFLPPPSRAEGNSSPRHAEGFFSWSLSGFFSYDFPQPFSLFFGALTGNVLA